MGRHARHGIVLIVAALLLGPACSGADEETGTSASVSTTSGPPSPSDLTPTTEAAAIPPGGEAPVDSAPPDPAATTVVDPPVSQAQGWRLVVTHPTAGATVGRVAVLCYEVTGPSGDSEIAFDVTLGGGAPIRAAASVGRAAAEVDLGATGYDPQDFRVQLVVDGERVGGASVTVPGVLVVPAAAAPNCA